MQRASVADGLLTEPQDWRELTVQHTFELRAAFEQRSTAKIRRALREDVERDVRDRLLLLDALDVARGPEVDATLQPLKSCRAAVRVERHDLAVDHQPCLDAIAELFQRPHDRRELRRFFVARAATRAGRSTPDAPGTISAMARIPSYLGS